MGQAAGVWDCMTKCPGVKGGWQVDVATKLGWWDWKGAVFCDTGVTLSPYMYCMTSAFSSAFQDLRASFAPRDKVRCTPQRSEKGTEVKFKEQGGQL